MAAAEFQALRKFIAVENPPLRVYIPTQASGQQAEWVVGCLGAHFWSTGRAEKIVENFAEVLPGISGLHQEIWPAYEVPTVRSSKKTPLQDKTPGIFVENTVPTSLMIAACIKMVVQPKRQPELRKKAYRLLRCLTTKLFQTVSEDLRTVDLTKVTRRGMVAAAVEIDYRGHLLSKLWADELEAGIREFWNTDLTGDTASWVNSTLSKPHVADLICFSLATPLSVLREGPRERLSNVLQGLATPVCFLVGCIVNLLNSHVVDVTVTPDQGEAAIGLSNELRSRKRQKMSTSELNSTVAGALQLLYDQTAPCHRQFHISCLLGLKQNLHELLWTVRAAMV